MRIANVSVKNLFGMFDHDIPLNVESRITIIIGPNGIGKTILLTMLHSLFQSRFTVFYEIPFGEFRVEFESGETVSVRKQDVQIAAKSEEESESSESTRAELSISYGDVSTANEPPYVLKSPQEYRRRFEEAVESMDLFPTENDLWYERKTGNFLTMEDVIEKFDLRAKIYALEEQDWYARLCDKIHLGFIQAERLQTRRVFTDPFHYLPLRVRREQASLSSSTVLKYSREIAKTMQDKFTDYGALAQRRDSSFPRRLLESDDSHSFPQEVLQKKMKALEEKRAQLITLGLLDREEDVPDIPAVGNTKENLRALSIYVQDVEAKFAVFDEIAEQLRILTDIIKSRFRFKKMSVNKSEGFVFVGTENRPIPLENLSSGEQHELVLIYQLLFHVQRDSVILIDEPELSLHVKWQRNFLRDIQRITGSRKFDVLLATHSPQIVADKQSWMVKLLYPEGE